MTTLNEIALLLMQSTEYSMYVFYDTTSALLPPSMSLVLVLHVLIFIALHAQHMIDIGCFIEEVEQKQRSLNERIRNSYVGLPSFHITVTGDRIANINVNNCSRLLRTYQLTKTMNVYYLTQNYIMAFNIILLQ